MYTSHLYPQEIFIAYKVYIFIFYSALKKLYIFPKWISEVYKYTPTSSIKQITYIIKEISSTQHKMKKSFEMRIFQHDVTQVDHVTESRLELAETGRGLCLG